MDNRMMILIGVMFVSGILGGIVNCFRSQAGNNSECFIKHLFMGISAAFIVPLFLKLIGSNLLVVETSSYLVYLEFAGFCLIAALSSNAFIEKISNRVITDLQETKKNIDQLERSHEEQRIAFNETKQNMLKLEKRQQEQQEIDAETLTCVDSWLKEPIISSDTETRLTDLIRQSSPIIQQAIFEMACNVRHTSWHEKTHGIIERTIPVFEALLTTESGSANHRYLAQLGYALKDQMTPDWERARSVLKTAIDIMHSAQGEVSPYYLFNWAKCCIALDQAGNPTNDTTQEKRENIITTLQKCQMFQTLKNAIFQDQAIKEWLDRNGIEIDNVDDIGESKANAMLPAKI